MKKAIRIFVIILLAGVFLFSGWKAVTLCVEYHKGEQTYQELMQFISIPATMTTQSAEVTTEETADRTEGQEALPPVDWPEVDFDALLEVNSDVVGWIYIPDTNVNYPIVQSQDNDKYLRRMITGTYNGAGSIFLDYEVAGDFSGKNSPIYGHNMKNGTMFAPITGYKKQEFYDAHPTGLLMTPEKNYVVHFFSGYVTTSFGDAWEKEFQEDAFQVWVNGQKEKSLLTSPVEPQKDDRILTLSTCSYETDDSRFVLLGVLQEYPK